MDSFYVTTPIYYVNDVPHLGHAYTTIVADVLARYHRSRGKRVFFLTGTDEHGQKIERAALANHIEPKQLADRVVSRFKKTWENLNTRYDDFIRTTDERHKTVVKAMWERMAKKGDIYLGAYQGNYCVACEEYYTEGQLLDGKRCPIHEMPVEYLSQPSYFFRMSKYQDALLEHFETHPDFVRPEIRRNEIVSFIRSGLRDLSISRTSFHWGIEVPHEPNHVIYVWIDALTNYISGLGGFDPSNERYQVFWPNVHHIIGKDILRFHAVYWPTMLMSADLPLPRCVFTHGWWTINGQKMSKTLGNVVEPNMIADDVGRDALRYYLMRETPLGNDGDFSHEGLFHRINAELANDLGNLLNRTMAMARKYCQGVVPAFTQAAESADVDKAFIALAERVRDEAAAHYESIAPNRALESIWELVRGANKYIDTTAPFKLAKDPTQQPRIEAVVANFLEALRWISLLVAPVMPEKSVEIRRQLGLGMSDPEGQLHAWPTDWGALPEGLELQSGHALFPRIEDDHKQDLIKKWQQETSVEGQSKMNTEEKTVSEESNTVSYDEFARLDLRVAKIMEAERVEGTSRLLKLKVNIGSETRQVVAGIAEAYAPVDLIDRKVIFVANLKPATIRGVKSEGMILAAGEKQVLGLSALDRDIEVGTRVK